ncbi:uncharacterized protein [Maniola hyperantus]|uniref:uncharacterized protein n=1 Tax=Aphantopus hyperantus TaxID=2795564 RepID=UPI00213968B2
MGLGFMIDILLLFLCQVSIIQSATAPISCWNSKSSHSESELISSLLKNENPELLSSIKTKKDVNKFEIDNIRKRIQGNDVVQEPPKIKDPDQSPFTRRNLDIDIIKSPDITRSSTLGNNINLDLLKHENFNVPKALTEEPDLMERLLRYDNYKVSPTKTENEISPIEFGDSVTNFKQENTNLRKLLSTTTKVDENLKQFDDIKTILNNPGQKVSNRVQTTGVRPPLNVVKTSPTSNTGFLTQPNLQAGQSFIKQAPKLNDKPLQESLLPITKGFDFETNTKHTHIHRSSPPGLQIENLNNFSASSTDYSHGSSKTPETTPAIKSPFLINEGGFPINNEINSIIPVDKYGNSILIEPTITPCMPTLPTRMFAAKNNIEDNSILDPICNRKVEVCAPTISPTILEDKQILEPTVSLKSLPKWESSQKVNDAYKANMEVITSLMSRANIVKDNSTSTLPTTEVNAREIATPLAASSNTVTEQNANNNVMLPKPITSIPNIVIPSNPMGNPFDGTSIQMSPPNNMGPSIAITPQSKNPFSMSVDHNIVNIQPPAIPNFSPNVPCKSGNSNDFSALPTDYSVLNHGSSKAPEITPVIKSPFLINESGFPINNDNNPIIPVNKYGNSLLMEPTITPRVPSLPTRMLAAKNNVEHNSIFDPICNRKIEVCAPTISPTILEDKEILEPTIPLKSLPKWESSQKVNDAYEANMEVITSLMSRANVIKDNSASTLPTTEVKARERTTPLAASLNTVTEQNTKNNAIMLPKPITSIPDIVIPSYPLGNPFDGTSIQTSQPNNMGPNMAVTPQSNNPFPMAVDHNIANIQPLGLPNFSPNVPCESISPRVLNQQKLPTSKPINSLPQSNNSPMSANSLNELSMHAMPTPNIVIPENQMTNAIDSGRLIPVANRPINTAITPQPSMCFKYKKSEDRIEPLEIPNSLDNGPCSLVLSETSAVNSDSLITEGNKGSIAITAQQSKRFNAGGSVDIKQPLAIPNSLPHHVHQCSLVTSETPAQQRGVNQVFPQSSNAPISTNNLNEYSAYTRPIIAPSNSVLKSINEYYTDYLSNSLNKLVPELTSNIIAALLANSQKKPTNSVPPSLISASAKTVTGYSPTPQKSLDYFTYPIINPRSTSSTAHSERIVNLSNTAYYETPIMSSIPLYSPTPSVETLSHLHDPRFTETAPNMSDKSSSVPYIASITINVMPPKEPKNNIVIVI